jgi:hypothetical protein
MVTQKILQNEQKKREAKKETRNFVYVQVSESKTLRPNVF